MDLGTRLVSLSVLIISALLYVAPVEAVSASKQPVLYTLTKVIDGDTLELSNGQRVRLIGVETKNVKKKYNELGPNWSKPGHPPKVYGSAEGFISDTVGSASVEIEMDEAFASAKHKDSDGNLLAYVYVIVPKEIRSALDQTSALPGIIKGYQFMNEQFIYDKKTHRIFLNGSLVWSGNAVVNRVQSFKYLEEFSKYQEEAEKNGRGQWPISHR